MSRTTLGHGFGHLLRQHRVAAGLTQEMLAERARMSLAAVSKLERGARQRPYRATIGLLAEALGLSPGDRLELERAADSATSHASTTPDERPPNNLPTPLSSFVGREQELQQIGALLTTHRLLSLVGAEGVGKTRLAARAAEQFNAANSSGNRLDGMWLVDLSAATDSRMTLATAATTVGLKQCEKTETLARFLSFQHFLLILDHCEQVADETAHLACEVLHRCPHARVLATSTQPLNTHNERIYRVPTLSVPTAGTDELLSVTEALEFSAIHLFSERAEAADDRFELTPSIIPSVAEICRRLGGVPRAIELAAARTSTFPTATIARLLDEHLLRL